MASKTFQPSYGNSKRVCSIRSKNHIALAQKQDIAADAKEIQRPKAIKSYRPMFDEEYIVRKDNDPNRERAEIKKLKRQIAQERKGAAREIKKDSLYVARKQHEEREEWGSRGTKEI